VFRDPWQLIVRDGGKALAIFQEVPDDHDVNCQDYEDNDRMCIAITVVAGHGRVQKLRWE